MDQLGDRVERLLVYGVITPERGTNSLSVWPRCLFRRCIYTRLIGNTINLLFTQEKGQPNQGLTENGTCVPDLGSCPKLVIPLEAFPVAQ